MASFSVSNLLCSSSLLFSHGRSSQYQSVPCFVFLPNLAGPRAPKVAKSIVKTRATGEDKDGSLDVEQRGPGMERQARHRPTIEISPFGIATTRMVRQMLDMMDRVFEDSWGFPHWSRTGRYVQSPWNVTENETEVRMRFNMPGLSREDLNISFEGNGVLVIQAQHDSGSVKNNALATQGSSVYDTRLVLPDNVETDRIKAEMKHGVLTIILPKRKVDESRIFEVQVD